MKKVLIVTGSPRPGSNSTILANAFAKGAEKAGHSVEFFDCIKDKVEGCVACKKCWSKGVPCVNEDGFNKFGALMEKADVVVFASPVYWGTFPAQLKALVDKFFAYGIARTKVDIRGGKEFVLLACGDGKKETAFIKMIDLCKGFIDYIQWNWVGEVTAPELVDEGEIVGTVALEEAEKIGREL